MLEIVSEILTILLIISMILFLYDSYKYWVSLEKRIETLERRLNK